MKATTLWKSHICLKYQHMNVSFQPPAVEWGFYTDYVARMIELIKKLMVIQEYTPTNDAMDEEKDEFYN